MILNAFSAEWAEHIGEKVLKRDKTGQMEVLHLWIVLDL